MSHIPDALAEIASINLRYALAEVEMDGSRDSLLRALEHIQQAEATLRLVVSEMDAPPEEPAGEFEAA